MTCFQWNLLLVAIQWHANVRQNIFFGVRYDDCNCTKVSIQLNAVVPLKT